MNSRQLMQLIKGLRSIRVIFCFTFVYIVAMNWVVRADTCPICLCNPERYEGCQLTPPKKPCQFPDRNGKKLKNGNQVKLQKARGNGIEAQTSLTYEGKNGKQYRYRIQKYMANKPDSGAPITDRMLFNANIDCRKQTDSNAKKFQIIHLYAFEMALRQNKIFGDPEINFELVRIPRSASDAEKDLIRDEDPAFFPFEAGDRKVLVFDWRRGVYREREDIYSSLNTGFRCIEEVQ